MRRCIFLLLIFFLIAPEKIHAANQQPARFPYFASLRADTINVRTGPSVRYPVKWVFKRKYYPVEIIASFQQWRKIRDHEGEVGWTHESLLSRNRYVLIQGTEEADLLRLPAFNAAVIARAERGIIAQLKRCEKQWCKIEIPQPEDQIFSGWIDARYLWGVYANEEVE
jgi:SH3-like domain-containing protein